MRCSSGRSSTAPRPARSLRRPLRPPRIALHRSAFYARSPLRRHRDRLARCIATARSRPDSRVGPQRNRQRLAHDHRARSSASRSWSRSSRAGCASPHPGLKVTEHEQPHLHALVKGEAEAAGEPMPDDDLPDARGQRRRHAGVADQPRADRRHPAAAHPVRARAARRARARVRPLHAAVTRGSGRGSTARAPTIVRDRPAAQRRRRRRVLVAEARPPAVHLVRQRLPAHHGRDLAPPGVRRRRLRRPQRRPRRPRRPRSSASTPTRPASTPTGSRRSSPSCSPAAARRSPRASSASSPTRRSRRTPTRYLDALRDEKTDPYDSHPSLPERIAAVEGLPDGEPGRLALRDRRSSRTQPRTERALLEFLLGTERRAACPRSTGTRSAPRSTAPARASMTERVRRRARGRDGRHAARAAVEQIGERADKITDPDVEDRYALAAGGARRRRPARARGRRLDARRRSRPSRSARAAATTRLAAAHGDPPAARGRAQRRGVAASA